MLACLAADLVAVGGIVGATSIGEVLSPWIHGFSMPIAVVVLGFLASMAVGLATYEKWSAPRGTPRTPPPRAGLARQVAAYGVGVGVGLVGVLQYVGVLILAVHLQLSGPLILALTGIGTAGLLATPFLALLSSRAVLRGGRREEPGATATAPAPAPASPPTPDGGSVHALAPA